MRHFIHSLFAWALGLAISLAVTATSTAAVVSVNFNGGNGNTTTANGPSVTGAAGAVHVANWNNASGASGTGVALIDDSGNSAGSLSFNSPNVYGANPSGGGTSGGAGDTALMTGYLDNFANAGTFATVTGLGSAFTSNGYSVLVYQNGDSNGSWGFKGTDSNNLTDTRFGQELNGNGGNYPLAGGTNGYVGSTTTNSAGPGTAANYVILTGFTGSSFTLTGVTGSTGDGRPRPNGFQIVANTPEPTCLSLVALGGVGLLARRRRASCEDAG